ncbi:MAG: VCBS repeat-containing protein [Caldilineaceae bacterium]
MWDGSALAQGVFEEMDARVLYSDGWGQRTDAGASGGSFTDSGGNATAWFPFTGDSVTFQAWARSSYHSIEISIDGVSQGYFNTYSLAAGPRAFSFSGLGDGPHVLEVSAYRNVVTVDSFTTPSTGENYTTPAPSVVIRLEEDHPDLRYNGYPYVTTPQSWSPNGSLFSASGGNYINTSAADNVASLDFEGSWVGVGFVAGGTVEVYIDGTSRGQFDTSASVGGASSVYYDDLITGTHTISVTPVSGALNLDYIDIWDGQPLAAGWYNADLDDYSSRFHYTNKDWWGRSTNEYAYEGDYLAQSLPNANPNIWFNFVGKDLTLLGHNRANSFLDVVIDGQSMGEFDMTAQYTNQPFALHFQDLGDGPHSVLVHTRASGRVDAFQVNPPDFYSYTPEVVWHDDTATEELNAAYGTGILSTIGIGDLDGDGSVELVAPGVNGRLYVYRGDGADTGDGDPILWTSDAVGPAAEPALADITGDGRAEIIIGGVNGLFAFHHDGSLLWQENSVKLSTVAGNTFGWGGPTLANLDADPDPEIVVAASEDAIYVLDHQGNILDSDPIGRWPSVPVLADITGDGLLDIVTAQAHTLKVHEFGPTGSLTLAWSYTMTDTTPLSGVFGSPAVADLTGDGNPEIIINWGPRIEALRADGSVLWSYYTGNDDHYRPSPITVADVTGDGEVNVITASAISLGLVLFDHLLMVLKADGTLVWEQTVADSTASASGVAAQDLTGNGAWEILWNGFGDGFLVIRGSDGKRLFNEPVTRSGTIMEYPSMGDVTGDGVADVVVAGVDGLYVISHVGRWVDSRPLWNQHNYHVTNINDDWSVPATQPNNWDLSNTYRTQTPDRTPAPSFNLTFTYTEDLPNVDLLPDTASTPLTSTPPQHSWAYRQEWVNPVIVTTFDSSLADMQPGETRQISNGAEVSAGCPARTRRRCRRSTSPGQGWPS